MIIADLSDGNLSRKERLELITDFVIPKTDHQRKSNWIGAIRVLIVKSKQKSRRRTSKIPTDVLGEKEYEEEAMKLSLSALPSWPIYFNYLRLLPSRVSCLHETPTHSHTLSLGVSGPFVLLSFVSLSPALDCHCFHSGDSSQRQTDRRREGERKENLGRSILDERRSLIKWWLVIQFICINYSER